MSIKQLSTESYNKEAMLVGILWNNPDMFDIYNEEKLNKKTFGNVIWAFYMGIARKLHKENYSVFDDITVQQAVTELKLNERYEKYGGYEIIEELMEETKEALENFEGYYDEVKKYALLREYYKLFGDKVIEQRDNYDYKKLSRNEISMYWNDKLNNIDIDHNETNIVAYNLLANLKDFINKLDINPDLGMPFYKGRKLTDIINGWATGTLSIIGAFSGNGKSSFVMEKLIMSCIQEGEKLAIIANEMDLEQYQKMLLITVMGAEMYEKFKDYFGDKVRFNRKSINKGNFTAEEKMKLELAVEWVEEKIDGNDSLIKLIPLEEYTMDNVEKVVKKFARRGYHRWIVDTAKPSEGGGSKERWRVFVEDFDRLYKLARKQGGGLNLAMMATVQQADTHVGKYWLNEQCLADGKKIKNVADLVWHLRPVHPQEYEGGANELEVINWIRKSDDMFNQDEGVDDDVSFQTDDGTTLMKQKVTLKQGKVYYLLFTSKNRRGMTNLTGLDVLVLEVDFNSNRWKEIGWCKNVRRDDFM
ncbi:replicative DNA helicase [Paenibacillus agilis]|uniref:Replicative DNA helicase n=1 Tax=Paenibacillus agilis TaxID=3020863 RepID=A0A559IEC6_9BACL|nr:replicative DNA helicase [Paenibacillus agilis]TVX86011.1 replicative DNA helicase [Paenibacillus agilis]